MVFNIFGNGTDTASWVPNPTTRGTWDIVQGCLLTISLCVWSAVHLNIPEHESWNHGRWKYLGWPLSKQTWRKIGWMILGLLAPELVAYTAWDQRSEASRTCKEYNEHYHLKDLSTPLAQKVLDLFGRLRGLVNNTYKVLLNNWRLTSRATIDSIAPQHSEETSSVGWPNFSCPERFSIEIPRTLRSCFPVHSNGIKSETSLPSSEMKAWQAVEQPEPRPLGGNALQGSFARSDEDYATSSSESSTTQARSSLGLREYPKRHPWTMSHAFYANMGGFATDTMTLAPEEEFLPVPEKRWTFNCRMMKNRDTLYDLIPDLTKEEITEKSKASSMTKMLVCLQAIWFSAQCLSRLAEGLPISLLELNTFGHAVCAVAIYLLWWEKPFDVEVPNLIYGAEAYEVLALRYIKRDYQSGPDVYRCLPSGYLFKIGEETILPDSQPLSPFTNAEGIFLFRGETIPLTSFKAAKSEYVEARVLKQLSLTAQFLEKNPTIDIHVWYHHSLTRHRISNHPDISSVQYGNWLWVQLGLIVAAFIYGGLHLLAWNAYFPTYTQQLLWRISAVAVMGAGPLILLFYNLMNLTWILYSPVKPKGRTQLQALARLARLGITDYDEASNLWETQLWFQIFTGLLSFSFVMLYVLARLYLVVECFINVSHLPKEAYQVASWSTYFPHIG